MMKNASTLILKIAVFLLALPAVGACAIAILALIRHSSDKFPGKLYPADAVFFVAVIPYLIALYQTYRLLGYIDRNIAFSERSVRALKAITYCGVAVGAIFAAMSPVILDMARQEDAPGVFAIGLGVAFASFVVAVFGVVLQRLLRNAIRLKTENEFTI